MVKKIFPDCTCRSKLLKRPRKGIQRARETYSTEEKMIRIFLALLLLIGTLAPLVGTSAAYADTYVQGYTKKDGTYVQPHYRSSPDGDPYNNWSTKGNVNPYTGERGTRNVTPDYGYSNSYPSQRTYGQPDSSRTYSPYGLQDR